MTQVMSTENTDYKFAIAAAAADALRESGVAAWMGEVTQPDKIIALAEQKKQQVEETNKAIEDEKPITAAEIEAEIRRVLTPHVSEDALRAIARDFIGANRRGARDQLREAMEAEARGSREEKAQHADADTRDLTPEERFQAMWNNFVKNEAKANAIMDEARGAGYISDEDTKKSKAELEEINKLNEELEKLKQDIKNAKSAEEKEQLEQEKADKMKLIAQKIIEHAQNDQKLINDAILQAERDGNYELANKLREASGLKETIKKDARAELNALKSADAEVTNEKLLKSDKRQMNALATDVVEEEEEIEVPQTPDGTAAAMSKGRD